MTEQNALETTILVFQDIYDNNYFTKKNSKYYYLVKDCVKLCALCHVFRTPPKECGKCVLHRDDKCASHIKWLNGDIEGAKEIVNACKERLSILERINTLKLECDSYRLGKPLRVGDRCEVLTEGDSLSNKGDVVTVINVYSSLFCPRVEVKGERHGITYYECLFKKTLKKINMGRDLRKVINKMECESLEVGDPIYIDGNLLAFVKEVQRKTVHVKTGLSNDLQLKRVDVTKLSGEQIKERMSKLAHTITYKSLYLCDITNLVQLKLLEDYMHRNYGTSRQSIMCILRESL